MKKKIYHVVFIEGQRYLNSQETASTKCLLHEEYDTRDEALASAKRFIQRKMLDSESEEVEQIKWIVHTVDDVTVEILMATGISVYQEIRKGDNTYFYEVYGSIIERELTLKHYLSEAFGWFLMFLLWPVLLIKGVRDLRRLQKKYPIDVIDRYVNELRKSPIRKWDEVYNKYFTEEDLK